jgi:hypothetical protein
VVGVSWQGYESFEMRDKEVVSWLNLQLLGGLNAPDRAALAAVYLSPLDHVMNSLYGVKYLRYLDDWVILCPSRWKMRRTVKLMIETFAHAMLAWGKRQQIQLITTNEAIIALSRVVNRSHAGGSVYHMPLACPAG